MTAPASPEQGRDWLRSAGRQGNRPLDIATLALILAWLDRPAEDFTPYFTHVHRLSETAASWPQTDNVSAAAQHLQVHLAGKLGYTGDTESYDDMKNADLAQVITRRAGLPVALSILYIHLARAAGWRMEGLNTPGHFLIRLQVAGASAVMDPFHGGTVLSSEDVEATLRTVMGAAFAPEAHAAGTYLTPVSDRDILLRLLNNIKLRAAAASNLDRAQVILSRMRLLAPDAGELAREAALLAQQSGHFRSAIEAAQDYARLTQNTAQHRDAVNLLAHLQNRLN